MQFQFDAEKTKKTIALVLEEMQGDTDPLLLEEYHNLFKKEVPLFNRTKAAAYLLMLCDRGKRLNFRRNEYGERPFRARPERRDAPGDAAGDENSGEKRYPLAEEESKRLFFSAGRSRRVFPREILGLINAKTAIPKEDIGAIRILDNYSFVQVRDTVAEKIIEALNGQVFRGRPLTVNYAKSRRDEENGAADEDEAETSKNITEPSPVHQEYLPGIGPVGPMEISRSEDSEYDGDSGDSEQVNDNPEEENI